MIFFFIASHVLYFYILVTNIKINKNNIKVSNIVNVASENDNDDMMLELKQRTKKKTKGNNNRNLNVDSKKDVEHHNSTKSVITSASKSTVTEDTTSTFLHKVSMISLLLSISYLCYISLWLATNTNHVQWIDEEWEIPPSIAAVYICTAMTFLF